jgi:hypothetical protein
MRPCVWVLGAVFLGLAGCAHPQTRLQAPDEAERDKEEVQTVGDVSSISNAQPVAVSGVGLVVGLDGTGGDAPPGGYRNLLEDQLRKAGVEHPRDVLASPNASMVLVSALIPPGAHKDDPIDVEVSLPPQSKTSSLRGGYLQKCLLYDYDTTAHLDPSFAGSNRLLRGHAVARAEGPVLVGLGADGDPRQGKIWGGGRSHISRSFFVVMDQHHQSAPVVQRAAQRINETFHGPSPGTLGDVAKAETKNYLLLQVPQQYRLNQPRFLRVVRRIPLREVPAARGSYRRRLEEELLDPAHTVTAALRLEALGHDSIPALKPGLESEHVLVRFCAAEALAYLGCSASGQELARLVEHQPALRAFSLTALASLDEAVSRVKLEELLACADAETRYGAFRAFRALDEHAPAVQGTLLNESFWLHHAAPGSPALVHVSTDRRAEVVLFGEDPRLVPPFSFLAGEFTLTAPAGDTRCTISRRSVRHAPTPRQCPLRLEDVLRTLGDMGGTYPEAVEFLRQAGTYRCLSCPVAVDALPQATSVYELARDGGRHPDLQAGDAEVLQARDQFGATPTLYDKGEGRRPAAE